MSSAGKKSAQLQPILDPPVEAGWLIPIVTALATTLLVLRLSEPPESSVLGKTLWLTLCEILLVSLVVLGWKTGRLPVPRWSLPDVGVALLAGGYVLSAGVVMIGGGDRRAALNLLFEWCGVGGIWIVLRSLSFVPAARETLLKGVLAILIAQAGLGIWQHHVGYAQLAGQYLPLRKELDRLESIPTKTPDVQREVQRARQALLQSGVQPHMLVGTGRHAFEARLLQSSEALGRCSLANTLAGLLLGAWVLLGGRLISSLVVNKDAKRQIAVLGLRLFLWGIASYALVLTKSRTAYLGGIVAAGFLVLETIVQRVRSGRGRWGLLAGMVGVIVLLGGIGTWTGGVDRLVWEEAPKSLKYRMEYWQGTMGVVREAPLLGVGPGQFRQHYLQYKLPESSEEIADPHNLFLDAWTSGGLTALLGLCVIVLGVSVKILRGFLSSEREINDVAEIQDAVWGQLTCVAGLVGLLTLFVVNAGTDLELLALGGAWLGLMATGRWWFDFSDRECMGNWSAIALAAIGLSLMGNGGMGMPTAVQCWLVLLSWTVVPVANVGAVSVKWSRGLVAVSFGTAIACLIFGAWPVTEAAGWEESADFVRTAEDRLFRLRKGAEADSISPDGWGALSVAAAELWGSRPREQARAFDVAVEAAGEAIRRDPMNPVRYRQLGTLYWYRARVTKSAEDARKGAEAFEIGVGLYPNQSALLADGAEALNLAGKSEKSQEWARRALELDDLNRRAGHSDKYLATEQRERLLNIGGSSSG